MKTLLGGWQAWLLLFVLGFGLGWQVQGWRKDAELTRGIAQAKKTAQKLNVKVAKIVEAKQEQEQQIKVVYRTIKERIHDAPDDRVCFDSNALQLWNDAIAGADLHRPEPAAATGEVAAPAAEEATVTDVLDNAATNYEICNSNSVKHNALIDAVEAFKGKMCLCGQ